MSIRQLQRTVAKIADHLGVDVRDDEEIELEAQAASRDRKAAAWLILLKAVPEELHSRLEAIVGPPCHAWEPFAIKLEGVWQLALDVEKGWLVSSIPAVVVEAFLDSPKCGAWLRCSQCLLRLPITGGVWRRSGCESFWQGNWVPFLTCPACAGTVVHRDGKPYQHPRFLPPIDDATGWRFTPDEWRRQAGVIA
jgi:hypothetical protein